MTYKPDVPYIMWCLCVCFVNQVVYNISLGTAEVDKMKPWLANIHARAPGCPVVIVGTHYDMLPTGNVFMSSHLNTL